MSLFIRIILALVMLCVTLFCIFGFLATFEPGPPLTAWTFRLLYPVAGLAALIGSIRILIPKRRK